MRGLFLWENKPNPGCCYKEEESGPGRQKRQMPTRPWEKPGRARVGCVVVVVVLGRSRVRGVLRGPLPSAP